VGSTVRPRRLEGSSHDPKEDFASPSALSFTLDRVDWDVLAEGMGSRGRNEPILVGDTSPGERKVFQTPKASTSPAPSHFGKSSAHLGFPCPHPRKAQMKVLVAQFIMFQNHPTPRVNE
jgi:hypothetical protein